MDLFIWIYYTSNPKILLILITIKCTIWSRKYHAYGKNTRIPVKSCIVSIFLVWCAIEKGRWYTGIHFSVKLWLLNHNPYGHNADAETCQPSVFVDLVWISKKKRTTIEAQLIECSLHLWEIWMPWVHCKVQTFCHSTYRCWHPNISKIFLTRK